MQVELAGIGAGPARRASVDTVRGSRINGSRFEPSLSPRPRPELKAVFLSCSEIDLTYNNTSSFLKNELWYISAEVFGCFDFITFFCKFRYRLIEIHDR